MAIITIQLHTQNITGLNFHAIIALPCADNRNCMFIGMVTMRSMLSQLMMTNRTIFTVRFTFCRLQNTAHMTVVGVVYIHHTAAHIRCVHSKYCKSAGRFLYLIVDGKVFQRLPFMVKAMPSVHRLYISSSSLDIWNINASVVVLWGAFLLCTRVKNQKISTILINFNS